MSKVEGIRIGKIKEEDINKARIFCESIFDEFGWDKSFAYGLENLKKEFGREREAFFLAKKGQKVVGSAGLKELSEKTSLMKRFYAAQNFRGKGLAKIIFSRLKKFAKEKGYQEILLDVHKVNLRAKRFYEKQGFVLFSPKPYKKWPESKHPEMFDYEKLKLN